MDRLANAKEFIRFCDTHGVRLILTATNTSPSREKSPRICWKTADPHLRCGSCVGKNTYMYRKLFNVDYETSWNEIHPRLRNAPAVGETDGGNTLRQGIGDDENPSRISFPVRHRTVARGIMEQRRDPVRRELFDRARSFDAPSGGPSFEVSSISVRSAGSVEGERARGRTVPCGPDPAVAP